MDIIEKLKLLNIKSVASIERVQLIVSSHSWLKKLRTLRKIIASHNTTFNKKKTKKNFFSESLNNLLDPYRRNFWTLKDFIGTIIDHRDGSNLPNISSTKMLYD